MDSPQLPISPSVPQQTTISLSPDISQAKKTAQHTAQGAGSAGVFPAGQTNTTAIDKSVSSKNLPSSSQSIPQPDIHSATSNVQAAHSALIPSSAPTIEASLEELRQAAEIGGHQKIVINKQKEGHLEAVDRSFSHRIFSFKSGTSEDAHKAVSQFYSKATTLAQNPDLSPMQLQELQKAVKDFSNSSFCKKVLKNRPEIAESMKSFQQSLQIAFYDKVKKLTTQEAALSTKELGKQDKNSDLEKDRKELRDNTVTLQEILTDIDRSIPIEKKTDPAWIQNTRTPLIKVAEKIYAREIKEDRSKKFKGILDPIMQSTIEIPEDESEKKAKFIREENIIAVELSATDLAELQREVNAQTAKHPESQIEYMERVQQSIRKGFIRKVSEIKKQEKPGGKDLAGLRACLQNIENSSSFIRMKKLEPTPEIIIKITTAKKDLQEIIQSQIRPLKEFMPTSKDLTQGIRAIRAPTQETLKNAGFPESFSEIASISTIGHLFFEKLMENEPPVDFSTQCSKNSPNDREKIQLNKLNRHISDEEKALEKPLIHTQELPVAQAEINIASAYSILPGGGRDGDPIADDAQMALLHTKNPQVDVIVYSGADGCGWGKRASDAAQTANKEFINASTKELQGKTLTLESLAHAAVEGLQKAQEGVQSSELSGTTTHTGIIVLKDTREEKSKSYAVFTTLGDMKVFIRDKEGRIKEPTLGNRGGDDPTDPGGRLGKQVSDQFPDLRNFSLYVVELSPGDTILPMSDGVHDNLDPHSLGLTPQETYETLIGDESCLPNEEKEALKNGSFDGKTLAEIVQDLDQQWKKNLNSPWDPEAKDYQPLLTHLKACFMRHKIGEIDRTRDTSQTLGKALVDYAINASTPYREAMVKAKGKHVKKPIFEKGGIKNPDVCGKTDHVSCGSITI